MDNKLAALLSVLNLPGYQVLCEYFEREIRAMENEVFNITPENHEQVLAAHRTALGAKWLYTKTIKKIQQDVDKALSADKPKLSDRELDENYVQRLETGQQ